MDIHHFGVKVTLNFAQLKELVLIFFMRVDQASLFESIMSGEYEYDDEYWSDISNSGNIKHK